MPDHIPPLLVLPHRESSHKPPFTGIGLLDEFQGYLMILHIYQYSRAEARDRVQEKGEVKGKAACGNARYVLLATPECLQQ